MSRKTHKEPLEKQSFDMTRGVLPEDKNAVLAEFDFVKFIQVLKSSLPWLILIMLVCNLITYLIVRYSPSVYESSVDLKLDVKQEASSLLGINGVMPENYDNLSGEIELLKSKLLFSRVINSMDLDVTYRTSYGSILNEERYQNSPFTVNYDLINGNFYDKPFHVEVLNKQQFSLSYKIGEELIYETYAFGELIKNKHFELFLTLSPEYIHDPEENTYTFTINSQEALIKYLMSHTTVKPVNLKAKTVRITFSDNNKYKARSIVSKIANLYLEYSLEEKNKANNNQIRFLDEQLEQTTKKLEKYEQYFEDFIIANKTVNLKENIGESITQLTSLDSQRIVIQSNLLALNEIEQKVKLDSLVPERLLLDHQLAPAILKDLQELSAMLSERAMLLNSYKTNTFAVQKRNQAIDILKDKLLALINASQERSKDRLQTVLLQKKLIEERFLQLPGKSTEYTKAQRQHNLYLEFYLSLIQKKAELEIAQAGTLTDFVILSPANLPGTPVTPKRLIVYAVGAVAGLFLSLMFVVIKYFLHNKISSTNELERLLDNPLLGSIPTYKQASGFSELVVHKQPKSILSESFRSIRTNMDFLHERKERVITVTSTVSGEGKTFTAVNLGAILALSNQKVIILDLDLRKPKIHHAFRHDEAVEGMSTLLIRKSKLDECIRPTELENMDYIPAGTIPPNPAELMMGKNLDRILNRLHDRYDTIIIDTPPVGLVTDPLIVMQKADIPIYVIRENFSKKQFLKSLNRLIKVNGFTNISVVLNATRNMQSYGSGYNYSYYENSLYFEEEPKGPFKFLTKFKRS